MAENLMSKVSKLLGVELGEKFTVKGIDDRDDWITAYLTKDGLMLQNVYMYNGDAHKYLARLITGKLEHKKLPWKPKVGDKYYALSLMLSMKPRIERCDWIDSTEDYALLKLGIIYKTEEEAMAHMKADYEELTGRKLEQNDA